MEDQQDNRFSSDSQRSPSVAGIAANRLRSFVERVERLHEEKRSLEQDISEVFKEAKGCGFDVKILKLVIRRRGRDRDDLDEEETLVEIYERALREGSPSPSAPDTEARAAGQADGAAGTRENAARWPSGQPGHGDYEMGHAEGEAERAAMEADNLPPAASRARARARERAEA